MAAQMAKNSQDTPEEEKLDGDVGGGGRICPEISRPFSKVIVLRII